MNLNANSWQGGNGTESSEGYNFNDSNWNWLGGGHYNSDGWINENGRVEVAAGGNAAYTEGYVAGDDDLTTAIAYYTETHKSGKVDSDGVVSWENVSAWDYAYQDNGDFWGDFLGGFEVNGGEKVVYNKNWEVTERTVDSSNLKDVDDD